MKILYKMTCTAEEQADPHYKDACEAAESELLRYMPVLDFINGQIAAAFREVLEGDGGWTDRPAFGLRLVKSDDD